MWTVKLDWVQVCMLQFTSCVTMGKSLNLSVPQFSQLNYEDNSSTYIHRIVMRIKRAKIHKVFKIMPST